MLQILQELQGVLNGLSVRRYPSLILQESVQLEYCAVFVAAELKLYRFQMWAIAGAVKYGQEAPGSSHNIMSKNSIFETPKTPNPCPKIAYLRLNHQKLCPCIAYLRPRDSGGTFWWAIQILTSTSQWLKSQVCPSYIQNTPGLPFGSQFHQIYAISWLHKHDIFVLYSIFEGQKIAYLRAPIQVLGRHDIVWASRGLDQVALEEFSQGVTRMSDRIIGMGCHGGLGRILKKIG